MIGTPGNKILAGPELELVFDAIPDLIAIVDYQHQCMRVNKAMAAKLGCPPEHTSGCHCFEMVKDDVSLPVICPKAKPFLREDDQTGELAIGMDGIYDISSTPISGREGTVIGRVHIARDIGVQKNKEKLLVESLSIGEYALNHSAQELLTMTIDKAETLTGSNIGFFHFLEDNEKEILLQSWSTNTRKIFCTMPGEVVHYPVDKAGIWTECVKAKQPVIHNDYESHPNKKGLPEGHAKVLRELTVPVLRRGKVVAIIGVGNKMVDYNQNDVENVAQLTNLAWDYIVSKQFEEALHKSEQYARALLNAIPDLIFRMNRNGDYLDFKGAREDLHYQTAPIIGKNNREVAPQEFADLIEEKINLTLENGQMEVFEYQLFVEGKGMCDFEARMVPSGSDEITAIARDITVRKQTEESLKRKVSQLEWFNRMMVDREVKMIDLKKEINALSLRLGENERYVIHQK